MKYLKLFNESLSQEDRYEISQYCRDIFLDLKDDGISINISWSINYKWIIIKFSRIGRDFSVSQYKDELRMLSSYLKSLGFIFNQQQKHSQKNRLGYYNSNLNYTFTFSYRLDDINESVHNMNNLNYDTNTDEEILEIKSIFMDIVDEFDLEQYEGQDDEDPMNYGIYYDIVKNIIDDNIIEIYLYLIDSCVNSDPNWDRFLDIIDHLKNFKERLHHMGFNCDYPSEDIGDIIGAEDFITIQIEKIKPIDESLDSLPKDIQDMIDNFPKSHRYKTELGEISMIHPCPISQNMYEILCIEGDFFEDIERYSTLEEAESRIDELIGWF